MAAVTGALGVPGLNAGPIRRRGRNALRLTQPGRQGDEGLPVRISQSQGHSLLFLKRAARPQNEGPAQQRVAKGNAQAQLKQYDAALDTLLQGSAVLGMSPALPGQPKAEDFLKALAALQPHLKRGVR